MKERKSMKKLKVAVIGLGSISDGHLKSYNNHPGVEIYAVCDINEERAKRRGAEYGASKIYFNYQDLLTDKEIDAVSICTWNQTHAEISIAALDAGKHVLVEKPLCKTVDQAEAMSEAVRKSGK